VANTRTGQGSTTSHVPGKRVMKEYPITEETLDNIGTLRTSASACFAIGSLALGFAISNCQSIALATGVSPVIVATWTAYGQLSGIVAVATYIAGGIFFWKGHGVLKRIKQETTHAGP